MNTNDCWCEICDIDCHSFQLIRINTMYALEMLPKLPSFMKLLFINYIVWFLIRLKSIRKNNKTENVRFWSNFSFKPDTCSTFHSKFIDKKLKHNKYFEFLFIDHEYLHLTVLAFDGPVAAANKQNKNQTVDLLIVIANVCTNKVSTCKQVIAEILR